MYQKHYSTKETAQSEAIPGKPQVPNSAGGYSFAVDDWKRLDRFLILGAEGGTFYIREPKLTIENASGVQRCIAEDGPRVVARLLEISEAGRAPKNDPALFVLAMCAAADPITRRDALAALPRVARTGTHLFRFVAYVEAFRGWGRSLRRALGNWYLAKTPEDLAYQLIKYQSRDRWSHRDVLRLAHPKSKDIELNACLRWATHGDGETLPRFIEGFRLAHAAENVKSLAAIVHEYRLPREAVPSEYLDAPTTQAALLTHMGLTALVRNLGTMTKSGLLAKGAPEVGTICGRITNAEALKKARVHPLQLLAALNTYGSGQGFRGTSSWTPVQAIVDALDEAFYLAFGAVEATGRRWLLALDVSGSMGYGNIAGVGGITPRVASGAMALVTHKTEPNTTICAFSHQLVAFDMGKRERLDVVCNALAAIPMGGTDCSQPMLWALERKLPVDVFAIYTDSEIWAGSIHPSQALDKYRRQMGIPAKLIVVGMVSNGFSIADPDDAGMLDVVGFDTAVPDVMAQFAVG